MSGPLWLATVLAGLAAAALVIARPAVTAAAPRLGASVEVLTLAAIGLMPPLLLACAAAALGSAAEGAGATRAAGHMVAGVCVLAAGPAGLAQLAVYGLAVALLTRTGLLAARTIAAARRAGLRGQALTGATPRRLPGGVTAWIVPAGQPAAYCAGLRRPRPVVTTGLLGLLTPAEQGAVLCHEAAHIRLGHTRILLFGAVIARSYRWLPPARLAWVRLRRDLEAAADDEAAAAAGTGTLVSALAKVALAAAPPATAAFADPDDLRYRIRRLQDPAAGGARCALVLGLAGALLTAGLALAVCQVLRAGVAWPGLIPCLAAFGYLGWRPAWARNHWHGSRPAPAAGPD
jgi:Zn-dependent protease with chaperone function